MKIFTFTIIIISMAFIAGCGPVRSGSYQKNNEPARNQAFKQKAEQAKKNTNDKNVPNKKQENKAQESKKINSKIEDDKILERKVKKIDSLNASKNANQKKLSDENKKKERFSDTVVSRVIIDMKKNVNIKEKELLQLFSQLENQSDENKFVSACEKALKYTDLSDVSDSVRISALFYQGECCLHNTQIDSALVFFEKALSDYIDEDITEKSLVRLGHIFCYKKDFDKAEMYFNELKTRFPESIYLPFANCQSVQIDE